MIKSKSLPHPFQEVLRKKKGFLDPFPLTSPQILTLWIPVAKSLKRCLWPRWRRASGRMRCRPRIVIRYWNPRVDYQVMIRPRSWSFIWLTTAAQCADHNLRHPTNYIESLLKFRISRSITPLQPQHENTPELTGKITIFQHLEPIAILQASHKSFRRHSLGTHKLGVQKLRVSQGIWCLILDTKQRIQTFHIGFICFLWEIFQVGLGFYSIFFAPWVFKSLKLREAFSQPWVYPN